MPDNKLENKIKEYTGEIFGKGTEPPAGHRERFEHRLKAFQAGYSTSSTLNVSVEQPATFRKSTKVVSLRKWLAASVAAAAVIISFVLLLNPPVENQSEPALADVRNYYNMQLEEQADVTRQLVMQVDEAYREVWLTNIEQIESESIPDVQIPDDEYIVLIADVYTNKIEILQNMQNIIREII